MFVIDVIIYGLSMIISQIVVTSLRWMIFPKKNSKKKITNRSIRNQLRDHYVKLDYETCWKIEMYDFALKEEEWEKEEEEEKLIVLPRRDYDYHFRLKYFRGRIDENFFSLPLSPN